MMLARRAAPNLPVHASTQQSITSAEGAEWAAAMGCERVVLGRELSVREISAVVDKCSVEVEVFVHGGTRPARSREPRAAAAPPAETCPPPAPLSHLVGSPLLVLICPARFSLPRTAMCVSYSGQCLSSETWGGRSANRGQCAQACRMPYGLLVNGSLAELGDLQYLLSPQVLATLPPWHDDAVPSDGPIATLALLPHTLSPPT